MSFTCGDVQVHIWALLGTMGLSVLPQLLELYLQPYHVLALAAKLAASVCLHVCGLCIGSSLMLRSYM